MQELLQRQLAAACFVYLRIHGRQLERDLSATSCSSKEIEIFAAAAAAVEILHRSDQVAADCRAVWRAGRVWIVVSFMCVVRIIVLSNKNVVMLFF